MTIKQTITDELIDLYQDRYKTYQLQRYADKYVDQVMKQIYQSLVKYPSNKWGDEDIDEISFPIDEVRQTCGRVSDKTYVWNLMQTNEATRLVNVVFTGNTGRLSRVILNPLYQEQIMTELLEQPIRPLTAAQMKQLREQANRLIPIDTQSLSSFIEQSRIRMAGANQHLRAKLTTDVLRATEILGQAETIDGQSYAMEYWAQADTGREYGHYNSLQRQNQEVRHAALGACHKYDFQAHSFAVMASIARAIDPELSFAQIEEYIRYRTAIRERIARDVGIPVDTVKSIFTSLGFGAKPINNPFKSIRRAVYTDTAYERLINQREFAYILEDLEQINGTILKQFPDDEFTGFLDLKYNPKNEINRRKTASQRLAWIYQNAEAHITQRFVTIVRERTGLEPLMTVHDCIYYQQRIPTSTLVDAQVILREEFALIRSEHEAIWPIGTQEQYEQRFEQQQREEAEHKEKIYQEERAAAGYESKYTKPIDTRPLDPRLAKINRGPSSEDLPDYEYEYEYEDYR